VSAGSERLDLSHAVIVSGRAPIMNSRPGVITAMVMIADLLHHSRLVGANACAIVRQASPDREAGASKDAPVFFLIMVGARFV
jgi:hypothetical protein